MADDGAPDIIIGAGLAGLSAAYHLSEPYEIHERNDEVGGLARSVHVDGFKFDYAPHILFTKDPYTAELIRDLLGDELRFIQREARIYHDRYGKYTRYPFQANLYGLPRDLVDRCVNDLKVALEESDRVPPPKNYEEWMYWRFGKGITDHLMIPYAHKLWTISPRRMNWDWVQERVPEPDIKVIEEGAYSDRSLRLGIHGEFWYPDSGAIEALPKALSRRVTDIHLKSKVTRIIPAEATIELNSRVRRPYKRIISSLALPLVIRLIDGVPDSVQQAAGELQHNSIVCVNLGVERSEISKYHWLYFYEDAFLFHRLSFPMNFSERAVPEGKSSICCEIAYSEHRPLPVKGRDPIVRRTISDLIRAGILREDDRIVTADLQAMKYAYVIYDLKHRENVSVVHAYLESIGIHSCGRFGEWEYFNMDESMMSGQRVAEKINALNGGGRTGSRRH